MHRPFLALLSFLIISGLVYGPFAVVSGDNCCQGCDCCGESCECQPQTCASNWQPVAKIDSSFSFLDILSSQPFQLVYFNLYSQDVIREVFHPPQHLS